MAAARARAAPRFIDIGANLVDPMFQGVYRAKPRHEPDLDDVLARARAAGVERVIITGTNLEESRAAVAMARAAAGGAPDPSRPQLFATVGVHPTRCNEFGDDPEALLAELAETIREGRADGTVVAVGEFGLDFERQEFCGRETQERHFVTQIALAEESGLPCFLHNRNTGGALAALLAAHRDRLPGGGVVHSFDGTLAEAREFLDLGFHIGINGCSLRTPESLAVVAELPADRLLLETDAPWCGVKATHPGHAHVRTTWPTCKDKQRAQPAHAGKCVKDRQEPCHIRQVFEVVAGARGLEGEDEQAELAEQVWENTCSLFGFR